MSFMSWEGPNILHTLVRSIPNSSTMLINACTCVWKKYSIPVPTQSQWIPLLLSGRWSHIAISGVLNSITSKLIVINGVNSWVGDDPLWRVVSQLLSFSQTLKYSSDTQQSITLRIWAFSFPWHNFHMQKGNGALLWLLLNSHYVLLFNCDPKEGKSLGCFWRKVSFQWQIISVAKKLLQNELLLLFLTF